MAKLEFELALLPEIIDHETATLVSKAASYEEFCDIAPVYGIDLNMPEFRYPNLHQHVIDLAKQKLSRRKSVAFRRVWSDLDATTQYNLLLYTIMNDRRH